jgi:hypothetical protein
MSLIAGFDPNREREREREREECISDDFTNIKNERKLNPPQHIFNISYNKTKVDAVISQIYSWNEILHVSHSSSVHHQEFFTVHAAMVYVSKPV